MCDAPDPVSDLVADVGGSEHGGRPLLARFGRESFLDGSLAAGERVAEKAMVKPGTVKRDNPDNKPG
jgi:hypothetical protein